MKTILLGSSIRVGTAIAGLDSGAAVTVKVLPPDGVELDVVAAADGAGGWWTTIDVPKDAASVGIWSWRIEAPGAACEDRFRVPRSVFYP